jgi:hypothetical protein
MIQLLQCYCIHTHTKDNGFFLIVEMRKLMNIVSLALSKKKKMMMSDPSAGENYFIGRCFLLLEDSKKNPTTKSVVGSVTSSIHQHFLNNTSIYC